MGYIQEECGRKLTLTLNRSTSSILAAFPVETQVWKKEGATDTPKASAEKIF